eukprot:5192503-Pyramimonas_sp.AAC.1
MAKRMANQMASAGCCTRTTRICAQLAWRTTRESSGSWRCLVRTPPLHRSPTVRLVRRENIPVRLASD